MTLDKLQPSGLQRSGLSAIGVALALALGALPCSCGGDDEVEVPPHVLLSDPRVAELLEGCNKSSFYDRFVDDMTPVLIEKLQTVGGEPLKRAKEELGAQGERAVPGLRRLVDESFADPFRGPNLENAIDALCLNDARSVHDILMSLLNHPADSVRQRAMHGILARHIQPNDFEEMRVRAEGSETPELKRLYVRGMFKANPARAARVGVEWISTGQNLEYVVTIAPLIAESRDEQLAGKCAETFQGMGPLYAVWIAAPAARFGNAEALEYLRGELAHELSSRRLGAVRALQAAGLTSELKDAVTSDPDESVRVFAIDAIASDPDATDEQLGWLGGALTDDSPVVRGHALQKLCELHEPAALDVALSQLKQSSGSLQSALLALKEPLKEDPKLARRAYEVLLERHALEELRPIQERAATCKAMGLVPLPEAAAFLRRLALEAGDEIIESLTAHDWLMIQASNTGQPGREFLWAELDHERDPVRRIELIAAATASRDPDAIRWIRLQLLELIEGDPDSDYELLFAAGRLIKIGPSHLVAPRLKLIAPTIATPRVQVALQCLLWTWY